MSNNKNTEAITEADLQAYVDGQLPETRHAEIEAWLAVHPEEAARLHAYRAQNHALHGLFVRYATNRCPIAACADHGADDDRQEFVVAALVAATHRGWIRHCHGQRLGRLAGA